MESGRDGRDRSGHDKAVEGFEKAYRDGAKRVWRGSRGADSARADAYQQAALEHWVYVVDGRVKREIFDGTRFDVELQVSHLLGRTKWRIREELSESHERIPWDPEQEDLERAATSGAEAERLDSLEVAREVVRVAAAASHYGAEVLLMRHLLDLPHSEIAQRLGITEEHSAVILSRVLVALRRLDFGRLA